MLARHWHPQSRQILSKRSICYTDIRSRVAAGCEASASGDAPSHLKQFVDQRPSSRQAGPSGLSNGLPGLLDVEARLEAALEAGTTSSLQAAIWYAVRTMAAANPSTCDLSKVWLQILHRTM